MKNKFFYFVIIFLVVWTIIRYLPTQKLCIHFVYKNFIRCMYTTDVYKMYTTFQQTFVYILYTKSKEPCQLNFVYKMYIYKSLSKCGKHFVYKYFVYILYILYTKCIQKFVEMWWWWWWWWWIVSVVWLTNERRFSLISSQDHCQRSSPSQILTCEQGLNQIYKKCTS